MNNFYKISEAMKYIDAHLNDKLSVQMIAEQFVFSPYNSTGCLHLLLVSL